MNVDFVVPLFLFVGNRHDHKYHLVHNCK